MNCDVCKTNKATIFLTQMVENKIQSVNLCDACSKEKGVSDPTGFALADKLFGLGASQEMERSGGVQKCPVCGFSQADFKKTGRLGCAACYETFGEGLASLLKGMHKGTAHVGKAPARLLRSIQRETQLKSLQKDLRKAVAEEDYESAAEIRDRIRHMDVGA
jgi:protein arginine kinase activator